MECLVQPPVAFVNVQTRLEALPIFYSVNRFHFEMVIFRVKNEPPLVALIYTPSPPDYQGRCPPDWWRAIGDTNLRSITQLSVAGKGKMPLGITPTQSRILRQLALWHTSA